jgi:PD-(D/E)XK endonuclease
MIEPDLHNKLLNPVHLDLAHRGQLAEMAFMRKAASLGFGVAKPWGESDRYDIIVRVAKVFWRIQVKSCSRTNTSRKSYRIKTSGGGFKACKKTPYTAEEIDFLVGYIFPKDAWYVFPVSVIAGRGSISIAPGSQKCRWLRYREAWHLLRPSPPDPVNESMPSPEPAAQVQTN